MGHHSFIHQQKHRGGDQVSNDSQASHLSTWGGDLLFSSSKFISPRNWQVGEICFPCNNTIGIFPNLYDEDLGDQVKQPRVSPGSNITSGPQPWGCMICHPSKIYGTPTESPLPASTPENLLILFCPLHCSSQISLIANFLFPSCFLRQPACCLQIQWWHRLHRQWWCRHHTGRVSRRAKQKECSGCLSIQVGDCQFR